MRPWSDELRTTRRVSDVFLRGLPHHSHAQCKRQLDVAQPRKAVEVLVHPGHIDNAVQEGAREACACELADRRLRIGAQELRAEAALWKIMPSTVESR